MTETEGRISALGRWMGGAEAFLDRYGFGAWIAAMVAGFIIFFPLGLIVLGYMVWSGRMGCKGRGRFRRWGKDAARAGFAGGSTGNAAFEAYKEETLKRLEEEQEAFLTFLEKLRAAKDKVEFDQFMADRKAGPSTPESAV